MRFDSAGWGVTPAAAGVRVARGRDGRKWPTTPTHLRPSRPSSLDRAPRAVTPAGLRLLRFVFVLSVSPL